MRSWRSWQRATVAFKSRWSLTRAPKAPPPPPESIEPAQARSKVDMSMPGMENVVALDLPADLSQEDLQSFKPFKQWIETLGKSLALQSRDSHPFHSKPYHLRSITVQSVDRWNDRIGFVKVSASLRDSDGEELPAVAFLRGPSVAMMVMLVPDDVAPDSDERYVVLTVQPRVPAGSLSFVELPAGMVDDAGSLKAAAAKEIEEELGVTIDESKLVCLNDLVADAVGQKKDDGDEHLPMAMFPSAGGCDEHITIYSCEQRVPRSQLSGWEGRSTGVREEGERIKLKLVPMKDLWKEGARDAKCLGALALWEALKREKKL